MGGPALPSSAMMAAASIIMICLLGFALSDAGGSADAKKNKSATIAWPIGGSDRQLLRRPSLRLGLAHQQLWFVCGNLTTGESVATILSLDRL